MSVKRHENGLIKGQRVVIAILDGLDLGHDQEGIEPQSGQCSTK